MSGFLSDYNQKKRQKKLEKEYIVSVPGKILWPISVHRAVTATGIARSFFRNCQIRPDNKFNFALALGVFFLIASSNFELAGRCQI